MRKRSNPFFTLDRERDLPPPGRLLARVDQQRDGRLLADAVDADWIERFVGRDAAPDLWRQVGPEAPVSVLEMDYETFWKLFYKRRVDFRQTPIIPRRWIEFEVDAYGLPVDQYVNLHAGPRTIHLTRAMTVDAARAARLKRLIDLAPYRSDKATIEAELPDAHERIDWIAVYDVGQGAASALLSNHGLPALYVDLGGGVMGHHGTFPPAFSGLCTTLAPPVILSHWDWDHWSSGARFPAAQELTWIVPQQTYGIVHAVFAALVQANGRMLVWPGGLTRASRGQVSVVQCRGNTRNDSGLAVFVRGPNGEPPILLPGDARYTSIPGGTGVLQAVVAPHHGAEMRAAATPKSAGSPASRVVYSYGDPNSWNHPRFVTRRRHYAAGWPNGLAGPSDLHTTRRCHGLGHVGIGWSGGTPPVPPCGGAHCAQRIVQT